MTAIAVALLLIRASPGAPEQDPGAEPTTDPPPAFLTFLAKDRPGPHRHDGFFLRSGFGFGYSDWSARSGTDRWVIRGLGMPLELAIGWAPVDNVVLFLDATIEVVVPSTMDRRIAFLTPRTRGWESWVGGGAAYYFMPANVHVTATLQVGALAVEEPLGNVVGETDAGTCVSLVVGKEWWVSANWGMGFGVTTRVARMKDQTLASADARWTSLSFALVYSATYN